MVNGLDKFREYFADYQDKYIIIGGTACDIHEEMAGQYPRATKDIDIILIVEAITGEFVKQFWEFIKTGEYTSRQRGNGKQEYFRFLKPLNKTFPSQIELFARRPDILEVIPDIILTPIPVDEDLSSLSAILMNEAYYSFTLKNSIYIDNIHIAKVESLIPLKAKAFLDLTERKHNGEQVDEKNIRKHKNDIFRLGVMLTPSDIYSLPEEILSDMILFCKNVNDTLPDNAFFKSIGLPGITAGEVYATMKAVFRINQ